MRTDNGHEFQAKFHWHVEDLGMKHTYIKPPTPRLNGKVERRHLTDKQEFYQLLTYTDDVDLEKKLVEWEAFYNYHRPHGGLGGRFPYEVLKEKMQSQATPATESANKKEVAPAVKTGAQPFTPSMVPSLNVPVVEKGIIEHID